jgi:hypothetical protein
MKLLMMNRNYPEPAKMMSLVSLLFGNTLIRKIGFRQSFQFHRQNNKKNASYQNKRERQAEHQSQQPIRRT